MLILSLALFFACDTGGGNNPDPGGGSETNPDNGGTNVFASGIKLTNGSNEIIGYIVNMGTSKVEIITTTGYLITLDWETGEISRSSYVDSWTIFYFTGENASGTAFLEVFPAGRYGKYVMVVNGKLYAPADLSNGITQLGTVKDYQSQVSQNGTVTNTTGSITGSTITLKEVTAAELGIPTSLSNLTIVYPE